MLRLRFLIVGFLLLWLPLQGIAAVTMPFCRHVPMPDGVQTVAGVAHQHEDGALPGHHQTDPSSPGAMHDCGKCGACHLACAPAVAPAVLLITPIAIGSEFYLPGDSRGLFIPEQPQPPPNSPA